jgi:hypothetical protein
MELYIGIFIVFFLLLFLSFFLYLILGKKQKDNVLQQQKPICLEDTLDEYIIHF